MIGLGFKILVIFELELEFHMDYLCCPLTLIFIAWITKTKL